MSGAPSLNIIESSQLLLCVESQNTSKLKVFLQKLGLNFIYEKIFEDKTVSLIEKCIKVDQKKKNNKLLTFLISFFQKNVSFLLNFKLTDGETLKEKVCTQPSLFPVLSSLIQCRMINLFEPYYSTEYEITTNLCFLFVANQYNKALQLVGKECPEALHVVHSDGSNLLHVALIDGDQNTINLLLHYGVDPNQTNENGFNQIEITLWTIMQWFDTSSMLKYDDARLRPIINNLHILIRQSNYQFMEVLPHHKHAPLPYLVASSGRVDFLKFLFVHFYLDFRKAVHNWHIIDYAALHEQYTVIDFIIQAQSKYKLNYTNLPEKQKGENYINFLSLLYLKEYKDEKSFSLENFKIVFKTFVDKYKVNPHQVNQFGNGFLHSVASLSNKYPAICEGLLKFFVDELNCDPTLCNDAMMQPHKKITNLRLRKKMLNYFKKKYPDGIFD